MILIISTWKCNDLLSVYSVSLVKGPDSIYVEWEPLTTKSGFTIKYQMFEGTKCIYDGPSCEYCMEELRPHKQYTVKVRGYTEGDMSPFSEAVSVTTEEDGKNTI